MVQRGIEFLLAIFTCFWSHFDKEWPIKSRYLIGHIGNNKQDSFQYYCLDIREEAFCNPRAFLLTQPVLLKVHKSLVTRLRSFHLTLSTKNLIIPRNFQCWLKFLVSDKKYLYYFCAGPLDGGYKHYSFPFKRNKKKKKHNILQE